MVKKEAFAITKINRLFEDGGWKFSDSEKGLTDIILEQNVKLSKKTLENLCGDFEKTKNGFFDFLLLDDNGFLLSIEVNNKFKDLIC